MTLITPTPLQEHLASLQACADACRWAGSRTATEAWEQCEHADWLLWWAARTQVNSHQSIVLAACDCARLALRHVPAGEDRPRLAIAAAERWAAEPSEVNRAGAAGAAARAAWAAGAAGAAGEAGEAGAAAGEAAGAAARAAWAAWAAARAAGEAGEAGEAGAAAEHQTMCVLVRNRLTQPWREPREPREPQDLEPMGMGEATR